MEELGTTTLYLRSMISVLQDRNYVALDRRDLFLRIVDELSQRFYRDFLRDISSMILQQNLKIN